VKSYKIDDPDYEGYQIEVPKDVVKDIVLGYLTKTYYWTVGILSALVGFLLGVLAK